MPDFLAQPYAIPPYGGHTSTALNDAIDDIVGDWQYVHDKLATLAETITRAQERMALQQEAYTYYAAGMTAAAPVAGTVAIDLHELSGITASADTAWHWAEYGFYGPRVTHGLRENQLVVRDSQDTLYLPPDTTLSYSFDGTTWTTWGTSLAERAELLAMADGTGYTALALDVADDVGDIWLDVTLPMAYIMGAMTNAIAIHPQPELAAYCVNAWVYDNGAWTSLPAVSLTTPDPTDAGNPLPWPALPVLFTCGPRHVQRIKLHYKLPLGLGRFSRRAFYLAHLGAYQLTWQTTCAVTLDFAGRLPDGATITSVDVNPDTNWERQPVADSPNGTSVRFTFSCNSTGMPAVLRTLRLHYTT